MSEDQPPDHPAHLDPSELGTKEYWDKYYENDLGEDDEGDDDDEEGDLDQPPGGLDPSELESWFDDVGAPTKTLAFLTSTTFPLSPNCGAGERGGSGSTTAAAPAVLDLGTGNGSALFALRLQGRYSGAMVGVDYSSRSVELARRLQAQYPAGEMRDLTFEEMDILGDAPHSRLPWWPAGGFDLVLDKGTFDAISLSAATITTTTDGSGSGSRRVCELYPSKVLGLVKPGGFLLVTSCNWTEQEVVSWFTAAILTDEGTRFKVYDTIKYPVFEFGGQKGQGVASVCFQKVGAGTNVQ